MNRLSGCLAQRLRVLLCIAILAVCAASFGCSESQDSESQRIQTLIGNLQYVDAGGNTVEEGTRQQAVADLAEIGPPAVEPLIAALEDRDDSQVRAEGAALALGRIRDPRAVRPLIAVLEDDYNRGDDGSDAVYIGNAEQALVAIGSPAAGQLVAAWREIQVAGSPKYVADSKYIIDSKNMGDFELRVVETLVRMNSSAAGPMISASKDKDLRVRKHAYWVLAQMKDPRASKVVMSAVDRRDWGIIYAASQSLASRKGTESVLIEALNRDNGEDNLGLAEVLLNTDNSTLSGAATKWADRNGYETHAYSPGQGKLW